MCSRKYLVMTSVTPAAIFFQVVILHIDMDAFFTSVEQADNPELRGKPVVIGQSLRGVASAASYEARRYGIRSAMPIVQAKKLCPHAVFLPGRMSRYREVSKQIMAVIREFCPVVEQASVDEAYADISGTRRILGDPPMFAQTLKAAVNDQTGLTCSIGIAPNKFLAKIASAWQKPDGLTIITPEDMPGFLANLPVARIPGVGKTLQEELLRLGVTTIPDVLAKPRDYWIATLGKRGALLHDRAQGIDPTPVIPESSPLSCSAENTFDRDTLAREVLNQWLLIQAERVGRELRTLRKKGQTVTLKIKFRDFTAITRSKTLSRPTDLTRDIYCAAQTLLSAQKLNQEVRLIGIGVSNFRTEPSLLPLITDEHHDRDARLDRTMDRIRDKFGSASIARADAARSLKENNAELLSLKNRKNDGQ